METLRSTLPAHRRYFAQIFSCFLQLLSLQNPDGFRAHVIPEIRLCSQVTSFAAADNKREVGLTKKHVCLSSEVNQDFLALERRVG